MRAHSIFDNFVVSVNILSTYFLHFSFFLTWKPKLNLKLTATMYRVLGKFDCANVITIYFIIDVKLLARHFLISTQVLVPLNCVLPYYNYCVLNKICLLSRLTKSSSRNFTTNTSKWLRRETNNRVVHLLILRHS